MALHRDPKFPYIARWTQLPAPNDYDPQGIALCLSGGGFRAAIFHLGSLRRLNELGLLTKVNTIASVSGGSILAGHLASTITEWPGPGEIIPEWRTRVVLPFRKFVKKDLRTRPILSRFKPSNWFRPSVQVRALQTGLDRQFNYKLLHTIPSKPRFVFCATNIKHGCHWEFDRERTGDERQFFDTPKKMPLACAVAASACFPPVFSPMRLSIGSGTIYLNDGGVSDNLALEPVWKDHRTLLVSNAGQPFRYDWDGVRFGWFPRCWDVMANQVEALRLRWLLSLFRHGVRDGTYWGIGNAVQHYAARDVAPAISGYSEDFIALSISKIRTDMDAFSDAEFDVLEHHGYTLAEVAVQRHVPGFLLGPNVQKATIPDETTLDEKVLEPLLRQSSRRFGRRSARRTRPK